MADPDISLSIIRPDDLLVLTVEGVNLTRGTGPSGPALVRIDPAAEMYLVAEFPPQAFAERAYLEDEAGGGEPPEAPPVPARASVPTRLAFRVPPGTDVPFTVEGLLAWDRLEPVLVAAASGPSPAQPAPPLVAPTGSTSLAELPQTGPPQTGIVLPYRLVLSPDGTGGWTSAARPRSGASGRVELWHARLGTKAAAPDGGVDEATRPPVRAVWSPDYAPPGRPVPDGSATDTWGRSSLRPNWRHQIVRLTSDGTLTVGVDILLLHVDVPVPPVPIEVSRLHLTALGGSLASRFAWTVGPGVLPVQDLGGISPLPDGLNVSEWRHAATLGRDHYVRVVVEGALWPTGHRAALVTVSERKFQPAPDGRIAGYLRQHSFVIVREHAKSYQPSAYAHQGREFPLRRVDVTTLVTPDLDTGVATFLPGGSRLIEVGGAPFPFTAVGTDVHGNTFAFTMPLAFVAKDAPVGPVATRYASRPHTAVVPAARLHLAERDPGVDGDTDLVTTGLRLGGTGPGGAPPAWDTILPVLDEADVRLDAVEHLTGHPTTTTVSLFGGYVASGMGGANSARVFAAVKTAPRVGFSADQAGGLATPNMAFVAVSQHLGALGGSAAAPALADVANGAFDPAKVFDGVDAMLFGVVPLAKLVVAKAAGALPDHYPKLVTVPLADGSGTRTTLDWHPAVQPVTIGIATVTPSAAGMTVLVEIERRLDGSVASSRVSGRLLDVHLELAKVLNLHLDSFAFIAQRGRPPQVGVHLAGADPLVFEGALSFVQAIRDLIPPGVLGDGPHIDVGPAGLDVGYTLALPPASVGIFAMQDIALSTGLHIPFTDGKLGFRFAISSREHPFLITVSLFGGGGFFGLELGMDGVRLVEASFEFGGAFALDIGVASGSVSVMAGIYLRLDAATGTTLEGFVRVNGEVEVLGLICVTVEFLLELSYNDGKATGQATLTVGVHVAFFSTSVSLTVERSFGGSSGDPTTEQMIEASDWAAYAAAFA